MAHHVKRQNSLVFKRGQIPQNSVHLILILVVVWLILQERETLIREGECSKQERFRLALEVLSLSLFAILVHHISDDGEINSKVLVSTFLSFSLGLFDEGVFLSMSMRKQDHHDSENNGFLLVRLERRVVGQKVFAKDMVDETLNDQVHLIFRDRFDTAVFHVLLPSCWLVHLKLSESFFMESIEFVLVELSHCPETRPFKEEVKILIILGLLDTAFFPFHLSFNFIFYFTLLPNDLISIFGRLYFCI